MTLSYLAMPAGGNRHSPTPDDIPRVLATASRVNAKPLAKCETPLDLGKPLLTVRSEATHLPPQLYEGRLIEDIDEPYYCISKFDKDQLCEDVEFHGLGASTKKKPFKS